MNRPRFTIPDDAPARLPAWPALRNLAAWLAGFVAGVLQRRPDLRGQLTAAELRELDAGDDSGESPPIDAGG